MKVRRFLQGLVVMMVLSASAAALQAQNFSLFVMGGGSALFSKKYYNVYGASFGSTYKTGSTFTVGADIPIIDILDAEVSYSQVRNNLAVTDFYNAATPSQEIGYPTLNQRVSLDAFAHAPKAIKGVRPYISAGLDYNHFGPAGTAASRAQSQGFNGVPNATLSAQGKIGVNFGWGLDFKLTRIIALRFDMRDHYMPSPTFGLPSQATSGLTAYYPISGRAQNVTVSAGFVFHFGK